MNTTISGWWLGHPSEKYESVGKIENVPNHQPDFHLFCQIPGEKCGEKPPQTVTASSLASSGSGWSDVEIRGETRRIQSDRVGVVVTSPNQSVKYMGHDGI